MAFEEMVQVWIQHVAERSLIQMRGKNAQVKIVKSSAAVIVVQVAKGGTGNARVYHGLSVMEEK